MSLEKSLSTVYTEQPTELHTAITEMMMESVAEDMEREDVRFILDVGCGMGVAWPGFAKHFPDATIHVITPDSVERTNAESSGKAVWAGETIESTACLEGFYGLIWARHSMEHTIHPYENLLKMHKMLSDKGVLYVEVPAPDTVCNHESNPNHYSVLGNRMWLSLFHKTGFLVWKSGNLNVSLEIGEDVYHWYVLKKARSVA